MMKGYYILYFKLPYKWVWIVLKWICRDAKSLLKNGWNPYQYEIRKKQWKQLFEI